MNATSLPQSFGTKALYALLIGFMLMLPWQVDAASMRCRSDPIVFVSDGTRLQFNSIVEAPRDDVTSIDYVVHGPVGTQIDRIIFTPKWARDIETVVYVADQAPGQYQIVTVVNTVSPDVPVEVKAMKVARNNGGQGSTHITANGVSGQPFTINFR